MELEGSFYIFENNEEKMELPECVNKLINNGFHVDVFHSWTKEGALRPDLDKEIDFGEFRLGQAFVGPGKRMAHVDIYSKVVFVSIINTKWEKYFTKLFGRPSDYSFTVEE